MEHRHGALPVSGGRTRFSVWAPYAERVELHVVHPDDRVVPMRALDRGYHEAVLDVGAGARYFFRLDGDAGREFPDPASRSQPEGVHGPSEVVGSSFAWTDGGWFGIPLRDYVIYELHVGTFTREGTFDAIHDHLASLVDLGVTAIELMPVAEFPGARNWGYDGVFPFAAQSTYGGPEALRRLVDACHDHGLAVVLDVVYNHLGPEGCNHRLFGPYFTERYATPWGQAINFDQEGSDEVRAYFIGNALYWFSQFHVDALRLDATHAILDTSALPFLEELSAATAELSERVNRRLYLVAESADNDARLIAPRELNGYGMDAQWNDDFHHALYSVVTGDRDGYYSDYGTLRHLATAFADGYVYQGEYSTFRGRRHGRSSRHRAAQRFVVFTRNHDQIGNRMDGARLSARIDVESQKLVAGAMLLSPYVPLLFMGEEYGETAPFLYFVSHTDPELLEAVREGRKAEFASFRWEGEPPDPGAEETFERSTLNHALAAEQPHATLRAFYKELLRLRRDLPALSDGGKEQLDVRLDEHREAIGLHRWYDGDRVLALFHFGDADGEIGFPYGEGRWTKLLESSDACWRGPGATARDTIDPSEDPIVAMRPNSFALYRMEVA